MDADDVYFIHVCVGCCLCDSRAEVILSTQVEASEASEAAYVWDLPVFCCREDELEN
jgi:hypothetical protein